MKKLSYETSTLIKYLKDCADSGKDATFEEMSRLLKGNVQYKFRNNLYRALGIVRRDYQMLFVSIPNEGYRPLLADVAKSVTTKRQKRIQSETNHWEVELSTIDTTKLDEKEFKSYMTASLKLGVQAFILTEDVNEKLELQGQKTRSTGLEYAKHAIRELIDVK
ncbi:hypothetical protein [Allocoleopsis sp.]|uniref:hypothetical protein n=1 Tax=Allocoleopsis sp. TaxID=3088169 RepID=UPI002FD4E044